MLVYTGACGYISTSASSTFSAPPIWLSQSCTRASGMVDGLDGGGEEHLDGRVAAAVFGAGAVA